MVDHIRDLGRRTRAGMAQKLGGHADQAETAMMLAIAPFWIESLPRSGPTVRSSITLSLTGSLPDASETASAFAVSTVK